MCPSFGMESLLLLLRPDHDSDGNLILRAFGLSENLNVLPLVLIPSSRQCHMEKKINYLSYKFGKKPQKSYFHWIETEGIHQMLSMLRSESISQAYTSRTHFLKINLQYPGMDRFPCYLLTFI